MHLSSPRKQHTTTRRRHKGPPAMPINQVLGNQAALYEHLPFSMSLATFVKQKNRTSRFAFGQWLATLDNSRLEDLLDAYRIFSTSDVRDAESAPVRNDMLTLLMTALLAEKGGRSMNASSNKMPAHIDSMGVAIRVETWRRREWVTLEGNLTIVQRKPCIVVPTDRMRMEAPETYAMIHREPDVV